MSPKTKRILSTVIMVLPALMLAISGFAKLSGSEAVVNGLTKMGFGPYIKIFGIAEIIFAALFLIPATYKTGFFLILSYLGGAAAVEIATGQPPVGLVLITLAWIGVFLRDKKNFLPA
ncbi:MAG: DoxX family protein [Chitinophagaceae bacterium]|nr:DoxX family protein [Chitinophagaceae bacterium]